MTIYKKNLLIIDQFEKLISQIKYDIDHTSDKTKSMINYYRLRQIKNSLAIIKTFNKVIKCGNQLKDIKGIGKGTIDRIDEILNTGRLSELKIDTKEQKYLKQIDELEQIFGIGRKTAYELITKHNINSIIELKRAFKNGKIDLPYKIVLGLKYHNVYEQQIPRAETNKINKLIGNTIKLIDKDLIHIICGSYRRKKPISNDIDVLITHKKIITKVQLLQENINNNYLHQLIEKLKEQNFIIDDIDKEYVIKYMGFCQLIYNKKKYKVRRIDFMYVPYESYYTALLHFTGSGEFNRKMRELAIELGYKLNQYGLYKIDKNGKKIRIKINSEKCIFEKLGLEYLLPKQRSQ